MTIWSNRSNKNNKLQEKIEEEQRHILQQRKIELNERERKS